jgi:hypothetical protein
VSEGKAAHLGQVTAHPVRARRRVRAARSFISPEAASAPIYLYHPGDGGMANKRHFLSEMLEMLEMVEMVYHKCFIVICKSSREDGIFNSLPWQTLLCLEQDLWYSLERKLLGMVSRKHCQAWQTISYLRVKMAGRREHILIRRHTKALKLQFAPYFGQIRSHPSTMGYLRCPFLYPKLETRVH